MACRARARLEDCSAESKHHRQLLIILGTVLGCVACLCAGLLLLSLIRSRRAAGGFHRAKEHASDFGSEVDMVTSEDAVRLPPRLRGCPTCWGGSSLAVTSPTRTRRG